MPLPPPVTALAPAAPPFAFLAPVVTAGIALRAALDGATALAEGRSALATLVRPGRSLRRAGAAGFARRLRLCRRTARRLLAFRRRGAQVGLEAGVGLAGLG
ncbi:MAG: hypothetical protein AVDCRST_MAG88-4706, partial [uncultured Thermomicrobiales bacterium]